MPGGNMRRIIVSLLTVALLIAIWAGFGAYAQYDANSIGEGLRPLSKAADFGSQTPDWTVMVYMNGDNDLEKYAVRDFLEMARVQGNNGQVNMVVQFDRRSGYDNRYGDWTDTRRFLIKKDMTPTPANSLMSEQIGPNNEVNMGDGQVLRDFVVWARATYPAKHYMLVLWDHGDGWRLLNTVKLKGDTATLAAIKKTRQANVAAAGSLKERFQALELRKNSYLKASNVETIQPGVRVQPSFGITPFDSIVDAPYRAISNDHTSDGDKLYNREVQDALAEALGGLKLDVIGFDACLMSMVETAYAMREVANVMVGSEELEPGEGWDYSDWLQRLVSNPTMDPKSLGRTLVESYQRAYESPESETTLAAIDLNKVETLASSISEFAQVLQNNIIAELSKIIEARLACMPYAPGDGLSGIDLSHFCDQIITRVGSQEIRAKALATRQAVDAVIIHNYAGALRQGAYGSHGLAIYFPENKSIYEHDPYKDGYSESNSIFPIEFVKNHMWDNFLTTYLSFVQ
jgi:hypothetical protein